MATERSKRGTYKPKEVSEVKLEKYFKEVIKQEQDNGK
jgi:hypothetical protein